jgi:hypothetical protein
VTAELKKSLLGPVEYEVRFGTPLPVETIPMPAGTQLVEQGVDWFRFSTVEPGETNPRLLRQLLDLGLPVVSLREAPRSLEQVYLQAMSQTPEVEPAYA